MKTWHSVSSIIVASFVFIKVENSQLYLLALNFFLNNKQTVLRNIPIVILCLVSHRF